MMSRVAKDLEVLMSIHKEWADLIVKGTKVREFKQKCALSPGMRVWIYATAPRLEIVGFFTIGEIRLVGASRPDPSLASAGAVTVPELRNYLKGLDGGFAIDCSGDRPSGGHAAAPFVQLGSPRASGAGDGHWQGFHRARVAHFAGAIRSACVERLRGADGPGGTAQG